ncbi:MAG: hypothetical protein ABIA63_08535, partial [bacterium]
MLILRKNFLKDNISENGVSGQYKENFQNGNSAEIHTELTSDSADRDGAVNNKTDIPEPGQGLARNHYYP